MHVSAPCHRQRIVYEFLKNQKVEVLQWPKNSPDLTLFGPRDSRRAKSNVG